MQFQRIRLLDSEQEYAGQVKISLQYLHSKIGLQNYWTKLIEYEVAKTRQRSSWLEERRVMLQKDLEMDQQSRKRNRTAKSYAIRKNNLMKKYMQERLNSIKRLDHALVQQRIVSEIVSKRAQVSKRIRKMKSINPSPTNVLEKMLTFTPSSKMHLLFLQHKQQQPQIYPAQETDLNEEKHPNFEDEGKEEEKYDEGLFIRRDLRSEIIQNFELATTMGGSIEIEIHGAKNIQSKYRTTYCVIKVGETIHRTQKCVQQSKYWRSKSKSSQSLPQKDMGLVGEEEDVQWEDNKVNVSLSHQQGYIELALFSTNSTAAKDHKDGEIRIPYKTLIRQGHLKYEWYELQSPESQTFRELEDGLHKLMYPHNPKDDKETSAASRLPEKTYRPKSYDQTSSLLVSLTWEPTTLNDDGGDLRQYWSCNSDGVAMSIIDSKKRKELLRLSMTSIHCLCLNGEMRRRGSIHVDGFQIDNQSHQFHTDPSTTAVYLNPSHHPTLMRPPFLQFSIIRNNVKSRTSSLNYLDYVSLCIQEFDFTIIEENVRDVFELFQLWDQKRRQMYLTSTARAIDQKESKSARRCQKRRSPYLYIGQLEIAPIKMNLSYQKRYD